MKARFTKRVASLNGHGYETMVRAKDQDGSVQILVKEKKDIIKELLIICGGKDDCALILLKGNIRLCSDTAQRKYKTGGYRQTSATGNR